MATGLAGGAYDGIQRLGRVGAQLLDAGHDIPAALHLLGHGGDLICDLLQQPAGFLSRVQTLRGQVRTSEATTAKPPALPPGPGRFDRRVEGDEVGQVGDLPDGADEAGDPLGQRAKGGDLVGASRRRNP